MDPTVLLFAAIALTVLLVAGPAVIRVAPAGHRAVVTRSGHVTRTRSAGPLLVIPVAERVQMVPLRSRTIDPFSTAARTRDGVDVRLVASVLWRVSDPATIVQAGPDARAAVADTLERTARHLVAGVELSHLLRNREVLITQIVVSAHLDLSPLGLELIDVDLLDVEVRLGPELLRLLV